ncbi:MAG: patatin [Phenylobacterium sp.]|nr:patatin [Phenylobacterium sp.]
MALLGVLLTMSACGTIPRPPPVAGQLLASQTRLDAFRFPADDPEAFLSRYRVVAERRAGLNLVGMRVLALSGGGANGAYGAGLLVGWTRAGDRPSFDLVTGVSTGALIAPLAFAGPAWDARLSAAYHDAGLRGLTRDRFAALFLPSLFSSAALKRLVGKYIDDELLRVISAERDKGRSLLVATTDLDSQKTIIWDLATIAAWAQEPGKAPEALKLFRTVLLASASIPGVFPPTLIGLDSEPGRPAEMHVDGGVGAPFFLIPESMALWKPDQAMRPTDVYIIINGKIGSTFDYTRGAAAPVLLRTFDTLGRAQARTQLIAASAFAERSGAPVFVAAIPTRQPANPVDFSTANMGALFDLGERLALSHRAFRPIAHVMDPDD